MAYLCVNIDHVATVRQARGGVEPDPVEAALVCERAGALGITFHLREDRRHIQDRDARLLREVVQTPLNMEMAATDEMLGIALGLKPEQVTLVPENRLEITTEGGLDVAGQADALRPVVGKLMDAGIRVSMFIDPATEQVEASKAVGAPVVEFHTGEYAIAHSAHNDAKTAAELVRLVKASALAREEGILVNAGHGLNYRNVAPVAAIPDMRELNIGHALVSHAIIVGLERAVKEMIAAIC